MWFLSGSRYQIDHLRVRRKGPAGAGMFLWVNGATARAELLTQTILVKAFRGDLVPTEAELARRVGRNYGPASALLHFIRVER
jgi:hypothetical protein